MQNRSPWVVLLLIVCRDAHVPFNVLYCEDDSTDGEAMATTAAVVRTPGCLFNTAAI